MRNAVPMAAFDHDRLAVRYAMTGVKNAGLEDFVHVERRELAEAAPPAKTVGGLVAVNPPYGERIEGDEELAQLYRRSEEHTSELQSRGHLVCRLLLEKK